MSMADDYRNEYSKEDDNYYVNHIKRSSKMQVTGRITIVQPRIDNQTNAQRSWQAHGKTNFTYDMTIEGQNGPISGEISSRSEGQYPKNVNDQITVNVTTNDYGNKFSAVQEQQGYQQNQQQPQQQAPYSPHPQEIPQNQMSTQDRIMFGQAINCTKDELIAGKIKDCQVERRARMWENILKTQQFPSYMREQAEVPQQQQQAPPQQPASQFTPENNLAPAPQQPDLPPFSAVDDIPF